MTEEYRNGANVTSAEVLYSFEQFLKRSKNDMTEIMRSMINEMRRVNQEEWNDGISRNFTDKFKPHIENVLRMTEHIDNYCRYIHDAAVLIEEGYGSLKNKYNNL